MQTVFILGSTHAGKTTFRRKLEQKLEQAGITYATLDILDCQDECLKGSVHTLETLVAAQDLCADRLKKMSSSDKDVIILEHTLLKKVRRPQYIEAALAGGSDNLICAWLSIDLKTSIERGVIKEDAKRSIEVAEMPDEEDSDEFDEVILVDGNRDFHDDLALLMFLIKHNMKDKG